MAQRNRQRDEVMRLIPISSIIESNGKTVRENNMARAHKIPIGTFIELICELDEQFRGARLWVTGHNRDCDGSPLYYLGFNDMRTITGGFSEQALKIINPAPRPNQQNGDE